MDELEGEVSKAFLTQRGVMPKRIHFTSPFGFSIARDVYEPQDFELVIAAARKYISDLEANGFLS